MAPNTISQGEIQEISKSKILANGKERKEIYYDGYFYDVTDFIQRHPGGNVIKFYTEKGEDATQAIQQFHYRSKERVEGIMKSFKRRPAPPNERGLEEKALARHEALSKDFNQLFEELKREGYFEPDFKQIFLRVWECVMLLTLTYGIGFQMETVSGKFLAAFFLGFACSRCAYLNHEGGHNSLTGRPKLDKFLQLLSSGLALGGSSVWWNSQHNRHHAMPQRLHHDVDLATLPYVAFHKRAVRKNDKVNRFFVRFQALFYYTLDLFVITFAWRFVLHPRYQLKKGAYLELLVGLPGLILAWTYGPLWYFVVSYWFAFFLAVNFSLNHSHLEVADKPTHWIEYSLTHTANISSNIFVDCWMGYLNYQIEHHLFPTMPQFRNKLVSHRVKALAEKYDLPYRVFTYPEACMMSVKNLNLVGKEITSKGFVPQED